MTNRVEYDLRKTASVLANAVRDGKYSSVVFASASRGEGTTTVTLHVANLLAKREGLRPLVVEVNREKPRYAQLFHLDENWGLAFLAAEEASLEQCIQTGPRGVPVIPAGRPEKAAYAGFDLASVLRRVIKGTQGRFDVVLVDAPALLADPDAWTVCSAVPRMVLVVRARRVSYDLLQRIKREAEQTIPNFTLLGAILNRHRRYIPGWVDEWLLR
jgi:succinoglycan biosynthesis transport protein ExoP